MKIVVNRCYGGFGLSHKATEMIMKRKGLDCFAYKQTKYWHSDGENEYTRLDNADNELFVYYQTKDLGKTTEKLIDENTWHYFDIDRTDGDLVAVVEELGKDANAKLSSLEVVEIPDDIKWGIDDYDGIETIHEVHRSW